MLGPTHRAGGTAFAVIGFEVMQQNDMLLQGVNPLLQLAIFYPVAQWASTLPDLDLPLENCPNKTAVNRVIHFFLHLTRPKHRSWQTHSILVTGGLMLLLYVLAFYGSNIWTDLSDKDWTIIQLLVMGFLLGLGSHLFLDFINPSGIHLIPGMMIHAVPKSSFFATGGTWENQVIKPLCYILSAIYALKIILAIWGIDLFGIFTHLFTN